jgi:hypothetical protein
MSDTSRVQLALVAESAFATQKTGVNLQTLRYTGESLRQTSSVVRSNEIRSDRMVPSVRRSRVEAAGGLQGELSYGTYDDLLAAVLQAAAWQAAVTVGPIATLAAVQAGNKYTDSANGLGGLAVGQWIYASGFTNAANNGFRKIVSKAPGEIVVSGATLANEVAATGRSLAQGAYLFNGTTLTTFNLEKTFADLSNELALLLGMAPNSLALSVPQDGVVTVGLEFMGAKEQSIAASGGSGYTAATTTPVMTALDLTGLLENQVSMGITGVSLNLNNNLRTRLQCGSGGVVSLGSGTIALSGTLQAYYTTKTLYEKFLAETSSTIAIALSDPSGNRYVFELPAVKITGGQRVASGPNGDVMADMQFEAQMHSTENVMIRIARWPAA